MVVTKEQAGGLWCPMLQIAVAPNFTITNRREYGSKNACIVDQCMMWEWTDEWVKENRLGYCGLSVRR